MFVKTTEDAAVAVGHSVEPVGLRVLCDQVMARIAGRFGRVEPRRTAGRMLAGLLARLERKSCWQLAEYAGLRDPVAMRRLLRTAVWDADAVRDDVRDLGDGRAVLVVDETGFVKKGTWPVGVQRQYSGTAGRVENARVAVFLGYASRGGHALIDRRLYLPDSWCQDAERTARAGVPEQVRFATKPALALQTVADALGAGAPAGFVAADTVYDNGPVFRAGVRDPGLGYVLAVSCTHRITVPGGIRRRVDQAAGDLPPESWQRYSAGTGSKGPRWYDWAWIDAAAEAGPGHSLMIRSHTTTGELAYYRAYTPGPVSLADLVKVAGTRWCVEESFQATKGQASLDQYQVRGRTGWHRFVTLAMLALAYPAISAADHAPTAQPGTHESARTNEPIPLAVPEIRRQFAALLSPAHGDPMHTLHWSTWRRTHQGHARHAHYTRRMNSTGSP